MINKKWLFLVIILFSLLFIKSYFPRIIDDLTPVCKNFNRADILYVTPFLNGNLSSNLEWCNEVKKLNKTIGLHGIRHSKYEFLGNISKENLEMAVREFEICFCERPKLFRPPYNKISKENEELVKSYGMQIYKTPYYFHPYCHCQAQGVWKLLNWLIFC